MSSCVSPLFDRHRLLAWVSQTLPRLRPADCQLDRLIPRKNGFDLRIDITGQGAARAEHFRIVPAGAGPEPSLALGRWRLVHCDPMRDPELPMADAVSRETLDEIGRLLAAQTIGWSVKAYSPGRRAVIAYRCADGSTHFGKLYRHGQAPTVLRTVNRLRSAGLAHVLAEPVGCLYEALVVWRGVKVFPANTEDRLQQGDIVHFAVFSERQEEARAWLAEHGWSAIDGTEDQPTVDLRPLDTTIDAEPVLAG